MKTLRKVALATTVAMVAFAGINTPKGVATQHLKMKFWDDLKVQELERALEYDGYSEEDVKIRIKSINNEN